jgi:hypothetical protein
VFAHVAAHCNNKKQLNKLCAGWRVPDVFLAAYAVRRSWCMTEPNTLTTAAPVVEDHPWVSSGWPCLVACSQLTAFGAQDRQWAVVQHSAGGWLCT